MMAKYIKFIIIIIFLIIVSSTTLYFSKHKNTIPMNVFLISVDTLRADHMGIYGYQRNTTPNIDKWAKEATVFTNAYTTNPFTYPSFASLMTGLHPLSTRIITNGSGPLISPNIQTLTKILKQSGYSTSAYVTNSWLDPKFSNLNEGFDHFKLHGEGKDNLWKNNNSRIAYDNFINQAIDSIEKNKTRNQFLWIHLIDPHYPYFPPESLKCNFLSSKTCETLSKKTIPDIMGENFKYFKCSKDKISEEQLQINISLYDGDIVQADYLVGKILNKIKSSGLNKNSLVIFYSDHGEGFDHQYYFHHGGVLYHSNTHIPLIIKYPSSYQQLNFTDRLVDNTDIFPSILNLMNIKYNIETVDGKNFSDIFKNNIVSSLLAKLNSRKYIYSIDYLGSKYSIFDGKYKYIFSQKNACMYQNQREELYDLTQDPKEMKNIISDQQNQAQIMKKLLFDYLKPFNYPQPENIIEVENAIKMKSSQSAPKIEEMERLKSIGY